MRRIITIIVLLNASWSLAQVKAKLFVDGELKLSREVSDSLGLASLSNNFVNELLREGFLFAGVDSVREQNVYIHRGDQVKMSAATVPNFSEVFAQMEKKLILKANAGYPFARIIWDSVKIDDNEFIGSPRIAEGPLILNDSIVLLSQIKTKRSFLAKTIGFEKGDPYSERAFTSTEKRLERITFITSKRPPDISFQSGKAWTYLDLEESNTGSFKGVLGLLPNQSSNSNALITGSIDLRLENLFRTGKLLDISWNRFGELSQQLDLQYEHPYLAGSDLSIGGNFYLLKQDSSFIKQGFEFNLNFYLKNRISMGAGYEQENSSVLLSSVLRISDQNLLDYTQDRYSLRLSQKVSNPSLLKNFFGFEFKVGVGQRKLVKNSRLPDSYYDSLSFKSTNILLILESEWQNKITRTTSIYHSFSSSHLSGSLSQNQLFRLGGLRTLRGFNEQFFFAQSYIVNRLEWRLFFEQESFLFAFVDQGFVFNDRWSSPTGFGGGFSLKTTSGLFSFAMALGGAEGLPLDLANTKVHFGYLSRF